MSKISLLAVYQFDQRCLGLGQQPFVTSDGARVVEDGHIHVGAFVGQRDPAAEIREIIGEWL